MPDIPILADPPITLRPPMESDKEERLALGRDPEIFRMYGGSSRNIPPLTPEGVAAWWQALSEHPNAWVIQHDGKFLGEARLDALNAHDKRARLAIGLEDPKKLGRGLGRKCVHLVLKHAFEYLDLHRVDLRVIAFNDRAIRCYKQCGFQEEGRERQAALIDGEFYDDVIMGLLVDDYRASQK